MHNEEWKSQGHVPTISDLRKYRKLGTRLLISIEQEYYNPAPQCLSIGEISPNGQFAQLEGPNIFGAFWTAVDNLRILDIVEYPEPVKHEVFTATTKTISYDFTVPAFKHIATLPAGFTLTPEIKAKLINGESIEGDIEAFKSIHPAPDEDGKRDFGSLVKKLNKELEKIKNPSLLQSLLGKLKKLCPKS